LRLFLLPRV